MTTDKFTLGYYPAYERLAREIGPAGHVLEVGVYQGDSLKMWQQLFPDGVVAGADCDASCTWPDGTVRIVADQDSGEMAEAARAASPGGWDLVVDDASHHGALSGRTFALLWPQVRPGGWYVLEDWPVAFAEPFASSGTFGGTSMLDLAQSWVRLLEPAPGAYDGGAHYPESPGSGIAELWYRYGQAMLHKAGQP